MHRAFSVLVLLCLAVPVAAHPLPNLRYDRNVDVRISPAGVTVQYTLDINEWTMVIDGSKLLEPKDLVGIKGSRDYAPIYAQRKAAIIADNLQITLDGEPIPLRVEKVEPTHDRDHLQLRFQFQGTWTLQKSQKSSFAFEDHNFEDVQGKLVLVLKESFDLVVHDREEPEGLRGRSPLDLKPDEVPKLRRASANIERAVAADAEPTPALLSTSTASPSAPVPSLWIDLYERGLPALMDSDLGVGLLLLAAMLYGLAHAFAPGHGKTMVAAYLIGERGTVKHAFILALSTTITHTGTVLIISAILWLYYGNQVPASTQGWLQVVGGLMIFGIGLWLLICRMTGKADHVHLFGDHHHHHHGDGLDHVHGPDCDHHHTHGPSSSEVSWVRLVLLGIAGGLVPCWGAVILLVGSVAYGRLSLGLPLVLAFSVGLGATLVALGFLVVRAHARGARKFGQGKWFKRLPIVGALLVTILGLWLAREGTQQLLQSPTQAVQDHK